MPLPRSLPCHLTALLACCAAAHGLRADLIKVSPFMPPQSAANAPTENAPLEYSGLMEVSDVERFRIVIPSKKSGAWLKLGERDPALDVTVKQHDADNETVTVEYSGQTITLPLKAAKVIAATQMVPPVPAVAMQSHAANVSPAVIQTVVANPTQETEQRRLDAIAAEVQRRRAMREQAQGMSSQLPGPTRQDIQEAQSVGRQRANRPNR